MKKLQGQHTVTKMAEVFGASKSGYYAWVERGTSRRQKEDKEHAELIRQIFYAHGKRYGSPRIHAELKSRGFSVGKKRVERLMRENGLFARQKRRFKRTTDSRHELSVAENLMNREFKAASPGEKWVSDITYVRTKTGWMYLTVIIDLYDRKVIGWSIADDLKAERVCEALVMACLNRKPRKGFLFHSDRGIQYCSEEFRALLTKLSPAARQSMSRKGNCHDNACAESFFKTLKAELEGLDGKCNAKEVRLALFEYIEVYYNRHRRHSAIGYVAPDAFTLKHVA